MLPNVFRILLMICLYRNGKVEQKIDFLGKIGRKRDRIKKRTKKITILDYARKSNLFPSLKALLKFLKLILTSKSFFKN